MSTRDILRQRLQEYDINMNCIEPLINGAVGEGEVEKPYVEETYDASGNLISAKVHADKIRDYAFVQSESHLTSVTFVGNVATIGESAFDSCENLILTSLPASLTSIKEGAFSGCSKIAITQLPSTLTTIEKNAFKACSALAITEIPASVTTIGQGAFQFCAGLTSITFKGTPTDLNTSVFLGSTNLTTINVPWAQGAVAGAPWGATGATVNYNYTGA